MITIACVLRSGGEYKPEHVWALRRGIDHHLSVDYQFRVLTDLAVGSLDDTRIPLQREESGWWSKMELFRPGNFDGPVLYFDLDTVLVGSIDDLASYVGSFALLGDFYKPLNLQSGVMAWTPGAHTEHVWDRFIQLGSKASRMFRGDGEFLNVVAEPRPDRLQDLFPRQIVSYKRDVLRDETGLVNSHWRIPKDARVVCFHGQPKPWTTPLWETGR